MDGHNDQTFKPVDLTGSALTAARQLRRTGLYRSSSDVETGRWLRYRRADGAMGLGGWPRVGLAMLAAQPRLLDGSSATGWTNQRAKRLKYR
jgi:hypothetical protein